ncbi:MAG: uracil-DNA glycosylase [Fulvimarina manganoxydans]|uniref:uracil-DNA glycosylase n=1 Tax=Fulvimarina manganoxydans TaxID=937218 RepID=UPI002353487A|nr:uracil-DNA glycosylase [Fulvimarina manganoxydans]MCK5934271.1 uracil-DNA glycosylase [Fulvimarina manganoxydans]
MNRGPDIDTPPSIETAAIALLEWYGEVGIDALLSEAPRDRFQETREAIAARGARQVSSAATARKEPSPRLAPSREAARAPEEAQTRGAPPAPSPMGTGELPLGPDVALADARSRARSAQTLTELHEALASFEACGLKVTAKSCVFGNGREDADLMVIGEAPGRDEDISGEPFVGRSGRLLDRMLVSIGIERADVRVTNTVPWRPPGNRPPTPAETAMCLPFLQRHIELVRPKILVCMGSPSAKAVLGAEEGIMRLRGKWLTYTMDLTPDGTIPATAMLHPAYLLRQPAQKRFAWRDLLALKLRLAGNVDD